MDLSYVAPASIGIGSLIRDQLLEVAVRVSEAGVRGRTVELMTRLLGDDEMLRNVAATGESERDAVEKQGGGEADVLWAAAWICGEYCQYVWFHLYLISLSGPDCRALFTLTNQGAAAAVQCPHGFIPATLRSSVTGAYPGRLPPKWSQDLRALGSWAVNAVG